MKFTKEQKARAILIVFSIAVGVLLILIYGSAFRCWMGGGTPVVSIGHLACVGKP